MQVLCPVFLPFRQVSPVNHFHISSRFLTGSWSIRPSARSQSLLLGAGLLGIWLALWLRAISAGGRGFRVLRSLSPRVVSISAGKQGFINQSAKNSIEHNT